VVALLWSESLAIIKTKRIPNIVRVVVKVQKVLKFEGVRRGFDQDEELSFNFQLLNLVLLVDGDSIVAIICHSSSVKA
jgi:hypothetical protein